MIKKRMGQFSIGIALAAIGVVLTVGGVVFGFGGRLATIETKGASIEAVAMQGRDKAEQALTQIAEMKGKIDAIYNGLSKQGIIKK